MPNTKSAAKELRKGKKRQQTNTRVKNNIKSLLKKIEKSLNQGQVKDIEKEVKKLQSMLDKAAKKNILKKNTVARKKSRLTKKINRSKKQ